MSILSRFRALQDELATALKADGRMRLQRDLAANASPGDVLIGPPSPLFEGMCDADSPTGFTYTVYLVEALGERAVEGLLDKLPALMAAVGGLGADTSIEPPAPTVFPSGTNDMPAYSIAAETTLAEDDS